MSGLAVTLHVNYVMVRECLLLGDRGCRNMYALTTIDVTRLWKMFRNIRVFSLFDLLLRQLIEVVASCGKERKIRKAPASAARVGWYIILVK